MLKKNKNSSDSINPDIELQQRRVNPLNDTLWNLCLN